jgi:hypothetical protein
MVLCSAVGCLWCLNQRWDSSVWEARQNDGFRLLLPVANYYGQCYAGFGIFWFMLIIYYERCMPMALQSRQMAFGLPNFLVWIFII